MKHYTPNGGRGSKLFNDDSGLERLIEHIQDALDTLRRQVLEHNAGGHSYRALPESISRPPSYGSMADAGLEQYVSANIPQLQDAFEQREEQKVRQYFAKRGRALTPIVGYAHPQEPHSVAGLATGAYIDGEGKVQAYSALQQGVHFEHKIAGMARRYLGAPSPEARAAMKLYTILHENFHRSQIQSIDGKINANEIARKGVSRGYSPMQSVELDNERHLYEYAREQAGMYGEGTMQRMMYNAVAHVAYSRMQEVVANYN